jgi:hypothetical protein
MPQPVLSSTSTSKPVDVARGFFTGFAAALLGLLVVHLALVYWQLGVPTQSSRWAHQINQKKLQRAATIQAPKWLVVGGSGALFGIQAELIEARLGYPTVNLGTHAALGAGYMLHLARQAARPGDTVLLALEYELYESGIRRDSVYIDYLFARDPEYLASLPLGTRFQLALSVTMSRLRRGLRNRLRPEAPRAVSGLYDPEKINAHGDQLGAEAALRPAKPEKLYQLEPALVNGFAGGQPEFAAIASFAHWARTNHVRVFATYPNIMDHPAYDTPAARKVFEQIQDGYAQIGIPLIGELKESMLPPSAFFDTGYHLTREGARVRTEALLPHLVR